MNQAPKQEQGAEQELRWMKTRVEPSGDGKDRFRAAVVNVPGAEATGRTRAAAVEEARVIAGEALGDRVQTQEALLGDWLKSPAAQAAHDKRCHKLMGPTRREGQMECHKDCLVYRTQQALKGSAAKRTH